MTIQQNSFHISSNAESCKTESIPVRRRCCWRLLLLRPVFAQGTACCERAPRIEMSQNASVFSACLCMRTCNSLRAFDEPSAAATKQSENCWVPITPNKLAAKRTTVLCIARAFFHSLFDGQRSAAISDQQQDADDNLLFTFSRRGSQSADERQQQRHCDATCHGGLLPWPRRLDVRYVGEDRTCFAILYTPR